MTNKAAKDTQVSPHTAQDAIFQMNINKVPMKKNKYVTNGLTLFAEYGFVLIHYKPKQ